MNDHQKKFSKIVKKLGVKISFPFLGKEREQWEKLIKSDPHLNNIDLVVWDRLSHSLREMFHSKGESWSLANGVCTYKEAVRMEVRGDG